MGVNWYALDGHEVVGPYSMDDMPEWERYSRERGLDWRMRQARETGVDPWSVAMTDLGDGIVVSTVFLGLDHGFPMPWDEDEETRPVVFETMVFPYADICERDCTWDEAVATHERIVQEVLAARRPGDGETTHD